MPKLRSFTLVELLIVLVIIGFATFLIITFQKPVKSQFLTPDKLRLFLHPEGEIYLFEDGNNLVLFKDKNLTNINLKMNLPEVYVYINGHFEKKDFKDFNDKAVIFHYSEKNGIGESFILKTDCCYYVFKPFEIVKTENFEEAKDKFLLEKYRYREGDVY